MNGFKFRPIYCIYSLKCQVIDAVISYLSVADQENSESGCVVPARLQLNTWGHGIVRCPFKHTLYVFIVRSSTKYDSYCTHCVLTTIDACIHVMHLKLKKNHQKNQARGMGAWCVRSESAFAST